MRTEGDIVTEFLWSCRTGADGGTSGAVSERRDGFDFSTRRSLLPSCPVSTASWFRTTRGDDSLVLAAPLCSRPGTPASPSSSIRRFGTPRVYAAKLSATLQRLSAGRLDGGWRVDVDDDDARSPRRRVSAGPTATVGPASPYRRTRCGERVSSKVLPGRFGGTGFEFAGVSTTIAAASAEPLRLPAPTVYLSGTSPEAIALAAEHGDVHLFGRAVARHRRRGLELLSVAAGFVARSGSGLELPIVARARTPTRRGRACCGSGARCIPTPTRAP
ncbi:LLM class flavin-dependent oxidoreductase [Rhodococcus hoagii]|nr:LLM class flavin-dependent oxidoreductase [Prescottella equi]